MNQSALMAVLQAARNQAIAQVQQLEAAIELLEGEKPPDGPSCGQCGGKAFHTITSGNGQLLVCKDCNHNQPA